MSQIAVRTFHDIRAALLARRELALLDVREEDPFAQAHPCSPPTCRCPGWNWRSMPGCRAALRRLPSTTTAKAWRRSPRNASSTSATATWPCSMAACPVGATPAAKLFRDVNVPSKAFGELVEAERHTPSLAAEEVQALLDARAEAVILDARRFDEYQTMSIPGGISVPGAELVLRVAELAPDPRTRVIVNCAGRTRSIIGTQSLLSAGIPNPVAALRNGTIGWTLAGQQLEHGQTRRFGAISQDTRKAAAQRRPCRRRPRRRRTPRPGRSGPMAGRARPHHLPARRTHARGIRSRSPAWLRSTPGGQLVQETDHVASVRGARLVLVDDDGVRANMRRLLAGPDGLAGRGTGRTLRGRLQRKGRLERAAAEAAPGRHHRPDHPRRLAGRTGHRVLDFTTSASYAKRHIPGAAAGIAQPVEAGTGTAGHGRALRTHLRRQPAGALRAWRKSRHSAASRCSFSTAAPAPGSPRACRRKTAKPVGIAAHRPLPPPLRRYRQSARSDAGLPGLGVRPGGATRSRRNSRLLRDLKPLPDEIGESSNRRRAGCGNDRKCGRAAPRKCKSPAQRGFSVRGYGGGGEIRTHGRVSPSTVFKTVALNHSATPPHREAPIVPDSNTLSNSIDWPWQRLCYHAHQYVMDPFPLRYPHHARTAISAELRRRGTA